VCIILYYYYGTSSCAYHYDIGCGDIEGQGEEADQRRRRARGIYIII